jgi:hypothetical protein
VLSLLVCLFVARKKTSKPQAPSPTATQPTPPAIRASSWNPARDKCLACCVIKWEMLATRTLFQPRVRERPPAKPLAIYLKSNSIFHAGAVSESWWFSAPLRPFRSGPHVRRRLASRVEATFSSAFTIEGAGSNVRLVKFSLHLVWFIEKSLENIKGTSTDIVLLGFSSSSSLCIAMHLVCRLSHRPCGTFCFPYLELCCISLLSKHQVGYWWPVQIWLLSASGPAGCSSLREIISYKWDSWTILFVLSHDDWG